MGERETTITLIVLPLSDMKVEIMGFRMVELDCLAQPVHYLRL
jgi:hypothetical protein